MKTKNDYIVLENESGERYLSRRSNFVEMPMHEVYDQYGCKHEYECHGNTDEAGNNEFECSNVTGYTYHDGSNFQTICIGIEYGWTECDDARSNEMIEAYESAQWERCSFGVSRVQTGDTVIYSSSFAGSWEIAREDDGIANKNEGENDENSN